jgi:hypothetical protein
MSYKCPFCPRTFSVRSAYSQHVSYCISNQSNIEESDSTNNISEISLNDSDQSFLNYNDQSMSISEGSNQSMSISDQSMSILGVDDQNMSISERSFNENAEDSIFEDILEESESEVNANFPNEAYSDLMALVTKNKLNNKTGNAIIKFFNKHANLVTSPLPKSIE